MRIMAMLLGLLLVASVAGAGEIDIPLKQGAIISWEDGNIDNISTIELAKTRPVPEWGRWNVLLDGWLLDLGVAYDANSIDTGAVLIGRDFGTVGKYLPIEFPFQDKINLSVYPIGIKAENLLDEWDDPEFSLVSGGAIVKLNVRF